MALAATLAITTTHKTTRRDIVSSNSRLATDKTDTVRRRNLLVGIGAASASGLIAIKPSKGSDFLNQSASAAEPNPTMRVEFPTRLETTLRVEVRRPAISRSREEKEEYEEVLVIDGIDFDKSMFVKFDVYINDEDDGGRRRPDSSEFAGSFVNVAQRVGKNKRRTSRLRLGLTDLVEELDADGDERLTVSLVPRTGCESVVIDSVRIELLYD